MRWQRARVWLAQGALPAMALLALALGAESSRAAHPTTIAAPPAQQLLVSERQLQAAMLAHNRRVTQREALILCVDYVRLGSHIPIERCDTAGRLAREGLLRFRELTKHVRRQAERAGAVNVDWQSMPALAPPGPVSG